MGTICTKKQSSQDTLDTLSVVISEMSANAEIGAKFQEVCQAKLTEE